MAELLSVSSSEEGWLSRISSVCVSVCWRPGVPAARLAAADLCALPTACVRHARPGLALASLKLYLQSTLTVAVGDMALSMAAIMAACGRCTNAANHTYITRVGHGVGIPLA